MVIHQKFLYLRFEIEVFASWSGRRFCWNESLQSCTQELFFSFLSDSFWWRWAQIILVPFNPSIPKKLSQFYKLRSLAFDWMFHNSGVQSKNNEYHIVHKVENQCIFICILNFIDNVVFVVFVLYSRISLKNIFD
jgi:hypothetical protein